jgi:regulator of cell morphogenesis and NO signaling
MTAKSTTSTLASLATTHPAASRVFQGFGLDYCCGGRRTLADACAAKGINPDAILSAIDSAERLVDLPRWDIAPLPELVGFIVHRYHDTLRAELPALIGMAARVEQRHGHNASCPHGVHAQLELLQEHVLEHLYKEEHVLFPMILAGDGARSAGPIRMLEDEHVEHGEGLSRLRELTGGFIPPADACATWQALYLRLATLERDLMDHVHLENNVLFPRALREQEL